MLCLRASGIISPMRIHVLVVGLVLCWPLAASATISGDLRFGLLFDETRAPSGVVADDNGARLRARLRFASDADGEWRFVGRLATIQDSRASGSEFWLHGYAPGPGGLTPGQLTVDEAYVDYRPQDARWDLRVGRFQATFGLADLMRKSLDQNDSPNFDVTWSDGAWLRIRGDEWTTHVLLRHNDRRGPTGLYRAPLDFSRSESRVSAFVALEGAPQGVLTQRTFALTWLPGAWAGDDYIAATAKFAGEWPLSGERRARVGGELGYATDGPGGSAIAWQVAAGLVELMPGQDLALVVGRLAEGWLTSADFRPGEALVELRWTWRIAPSWTMTSRVRRRLQNEIPVGGVARRRSADAYFRLDFRF